MAKDVIGMPFVGQLVEGVILDIPALVAENNGALGGSWAAGAVVTQIHSLLRSSGWRSSCRRTV